MIYELENSHILVGFKNESLNVNKTLQGTFTVLSDQQK